MEKFGYARVSTTDQTAANQRLELERAGHQVADRYWFVDEGVSGKTPAATRPAFQKLLGKLREGDELVVSKLDRLGRDAVDVVQTLERLHSDGVRVRVLQLPELNMTSPTGKLVCTVLGAVAQMERDLLAERTRAGLDRAKRDGRILGRRPALSGPRLVQVRERLRAGAGVSTLAREFDVARNTIYKVRRELQSG